MIRFFIKFYIRYTWEYPQAVIGNLLLMYLWCNNSVISTEEIINKGVILITSSYINTPMAFGMFVFIPSHKFPNRLLDRVIGNSWLSMIFGPLYLPIIGIPKSIWYILKIKLGLFKNKSYNSFYTERWSINLGKR